MVRSPRCCNNIYNVASGSYYEYGGTVNLGGIDGEYLQIKLPDPVLITNFTMSGAANENLPRSFKLLARYSVHDPGGQGLRRHKLKDETRGVGG